MSFEVEQDSRKWKSASRRLRGTRYQAQLRMAACAGRTGKAFTSRADERCREYAKRMGAEWKANGLRHSFISCQCATTKNLPATAMEAGNGATVTNELRELTTEADGKDRFAIVPHALSIKIAPAPWRARNAGRTRAPGCDFSEGFVMSRAKRDD